MGFPRVSETFIASELLPRRARRGPRPPVRHQARRGARARARHPVVDAIAAQPESTCRTRASLTAPLHRWRPRHLRPFAPAIRAHAAPPARGSRARRRHRARPGDPRPPHARSPARARSTSRSCSRRSRSPTGCSTRPTSAHLHAHFAHGTTTVTWLAAHASPACRSRSPATRATSTRPTSTRTAGCGASCSPPRFVVTCTAANVRAPAPHRAASADVHLVYHGLNADFARLLEAPAPARRGNGTLRVLGVGRLVAKKGFDVLVEACAVLRRARRAVRGADRRPGRQARRRDRARAVARARPRRHDPAARADGPAGAARRVPPAHARCACRAACCPTTATGSPTSWWRRWRAGTPVVATAVSGIPELVTDGVNGLLIAPGGPGGARRRARSGCTTTPQLADAARDAAPHTVRERFDGDRLAGELAALFAEADALTRRSPPRGRSLRADLPDGAPRPRPSPRPSPRGPLHPPRRDARPRHASPTGWPPSCRPTRSGGSTGSSSTTGSTSPTPYRDDRRRAVQATRGSGSIGVVDPRRSRPTTTPPTVTAPPHPELDLRLAGASRELRPATAPASLGSMDEQAAHVRATTSRRSATTARSSCTRCSIAALALPELDVDGELLTFAIAELDAQPRRRTSAPTACTRGFDALPLDRRCARSWARARTPPLRPRAAPGRSTSGWPRRCDFACTATVPTARSPPLSDGDTRATTNSWSWPPTS